MLTHNIEKIIDKNLSWCMTGKKDLIQRDIKKAASEIDDCFKKSINKYSLTQFLTGYGINKADELAEALIKWINN